MQSVFHVSGQVEHVLVQARQGWPWLSRTTIPSRWNASVKAFDIWQACSCFPAAVQKKNVCCLFARCTTDLRTASKASISLFDSADTTILAEPKKADVLCALSAVDVDDRHRATGGRPVEFICRHSKNSARSLGVRTGNL